MMTRSDSRKAFGLILFFFLVNIAQSIFTPLHFDEVYYWVFSKRLDWGYFDHPPMVALSMALGGLLSDGAAMLRLAVVLMQPVWLYLFVKSIDGQMNYNQRRRLDLLVLLMFSLPIVHLTGFVATPDAPLMLFAFLFLYGFYIFDRLPAWSGILWLGLSMAAMAYSKYHGALVVLFAVLWNFRMLLNWRFYVACLIALILFIPHLWWQYEHDFASFTYHLSERSRDFSWEEVGSFAATLFFGFNPFLFPLFVRSFRLGKSSDWERLLNFVSIGFMFFCAIMSVRGHVQLQWMAVASFGYVASVYRVALKDQKTTKYVSRVAGVTVILFLVLRLALCFDTPLWKLTGLGRDRNDMETIHRTLKDTPVLLTDTYFKTAAYQYYGGFNATFPPDLFKRGNQYRFYNDDIDFMGKTVAFESSQGKYEIPLEGNRIFKYNLIDDYIPIKRVKAVVRIDDSESFENDSIPIVVLWENPYGHSVPLSLQSGSQVRILVGKKGEYSYNEVQSDRRETIPATGTLQSRYFVPRSVIHSGDLIFVCIERLPLPYWFAGRTTIENR